MRAGSSGNSKRRGGQLVAAALAGAARTGLGAPVLFGVPGESYLELLDAFIDTPPLRFITTRQEGGAAFMAEAWGKLTGQPGVVCVTRGPGACNATIGLHTAQQDSTPLLALIGQVAREQSEREAFQEIDYRRMLFPLCKWVAQIDQTARVPELVGRALHTAMSGRPGPVALALPEDMLRDSATVADRAPSPPALPHPGPAELAAVEARLRTARRPLLLVGGGGWDDTACARLRTFAEGWHLPVCCSFRRNDLLASDSPSFVGEMGIAPNPALLEWVRQADLLLVLGARLGEMTSQGYRLLDVPQPVQTLVHAHSAPEELGRVFRPEIGIVSAPGPLMAALATWSPPVPAPVWADWTAAARAAARQWHEALVPCVGAVDMSALFAWLREHLPVDTVVATDAGNFAAWGQRFLACRRPGRLLGPTNGAMGYGVPAAIAACLWRPERRTVALVGDGGFLMTGQELATARHYGLAPIILVFNNGLYGTIRMHQERRFPGRECGTRLTNPDFAALAHSYGAFGAVVARTADFAPAFAAAVASGQAAVLDIRMDPEQISPRSTLAALRACAEQ